MVRLLTFQGRFAVFIVYSQTQDRCRYRSRTRRLHVRLLLVLFRVFLLIFNLQQRGIRASFEVGRPLPLRDRYVYYPWEQALSRIELPV